MSHIQCLKHKQKKSHLKVPSILRVHTVQMAVDLSTVINTKEQ